MNVSVSKLFKVASLVAFGAAAINATLFSHSGVELLGAGLFLFAGGDIAEDVLAD